MIQLTKLNNSPCLLNVEAIKYIESTPDTLIYFLNGESMLVKENFEEIRQKVVDFKKQIFKENH